MAAAVFLSFFKTMHARASEHVITFYFYYMFATSSLFFVFSVFCSKAYTNPFTISHRRYNPNGSKSHLAIFPSSHGWTTRKFHYFPLNVFAVLPCCSNILNLPCFFKVSPLSPCSSIVFKQQYHLVLNDRNRSATSSREIALQFEYC